MAYLRVKSIRGQKYLYLVKSAWDAKKKTSKQTIIKYLGIESNVSMADIPKEYQTSTKIIDYFMNQKYFQPIVQNEITDKLQKNNIKVFGPNKIASQLEGSKIFTKKLCQEYSIPTANFGIFENKDSPNKQRNQYLLPTSYCGKVKL